MAKQPGKIKFFNEAKGYGFITPDDGSGEVFLHSKVCQRWGLEPSQGMPVIFEADQGVKGRKATWVGA